MIKKFYKQQFKFQFHTSKIKYQDQQINEFAKMIQKDLNKSSTLSEVLEKVWANEKVTQVCPNLTIRLTSLRGQVSRKIWENLGKDPKEINILAVGTTDIPHHLKGYQEFIKSFYKRTSQMLESNKIEIGYDLVSRGSYEARKLVLNMFNEHYNINSQDLEEIYSNSAIICGGMRGLKDIADGCVLYAKSNQQTHKFIQPDNSFGTWFQIIERPDTNDKNRREIHTITTDPSNKLHLTQDDVLKFYSNNKPTNFESWYITPAGNPSGTKMTPDQLYSTCKTIIKKSPNALILLDVVYVRTLPKLEAQKLLKDVIQDKELLNRVMWLDSFSKSHGLCRERLGMYFSVNSDLFARYHAANITYSAGPGQIKDIQFHCLGTMSEKDKKSIEELHEFWRRERKGLYNYLSKFIDLFEPEQKHITSDDLEKSLGLYILMKTKPGIKAQNVFIKTGILGVDTMMGSGHHIRFSVGTLLEPTYSNK